jgi:D-3-phosphoglycerate dehydrogenase
MVKVLISDKMNPLAAEIFQQKGVEVDVKTGLSPEELKAIIGEYDGLAMRSSSTITADILSAAHKLKVIGRAGIGVDNIDVAAATAKGVVVMNTPFGNSITTAEHAIAMMFALARQIPQANASTHASKWEKSKFMGVELTAKTLGVIGCGNIGAIAAARGIGLKMKVIAFDPFLTVERATELGVEKVELDDLYQRADFITIHVPKNEHTLHMLNAAAFTKMKDGVRIINCARGGIIVEADLKVALESGKVAGAALDVFEAEPAKDNALFGMDNVICTPHLGAATTEAQVNVAVQVAEQLGDFLTTGAVTNALNMAPISAEDAPKLNPYLALARQLGSFAGQISEHAITKIEIEFQGLVTELNTRPISDTLLAALLQTFRDQINMVNVRNMLKEMKISLTESASDDCDEFLTAIELTIHTETNKRSITGTLFAGKEPRIVNIEGVPIEATISKHMLFVRNDDKPGLIGGIGTVLADAGVNIADFRLGRKTEGNQALALIAIDETLSETLQVQINALPQVRLAKSLSFV